jgi:hypothetical protein
VNMNTHLATIHDTAIRLNSAINMPSSIGRTLDGSVLHRDFVKAIDTALASGLGDEDITRQLSASLGGLKQAHEFLKSHVKEHQRNVNGKLVLVHEHQDSRPDAKDKLSDADLAKMLDLSTPKIWRDKDGKEDCRCFRCGKPIRTVADVAVDGGGLQHLGLDCLLTLKGKKSGKKITPAAQRQIIQEYLEKSYVDAMKNARVELKLKSKRQMGDEVYESEVDGESTAGSYPVRYGAVNAVKYALQEFRERAWGKVRSEYTSLTGAKTFESAARLKAPNPIVVKFSVDGHEFDPQATLYEEKS